MTQDKVSAESREELIGRLAAEIRYETPKLSEVSKFLERKLAKAYDAGKASQSTPEKQRIIEHAAELYLDLANREGSEADRNAARDLYNFVAFADELPEQVASAGTPQKCRTCGTELPDCAITNECDMCFDRRMDKRSAGTPKEKIDD